MYSTEQLKVSCVFFQNEKFVGILLEILLFSANTNGALLPSKSLSLQETHLVRCLTYISHKYFAPGRSLVISSPSAYRDVQQKLVAEIHRTSIWPVVVTVDGNISKGNKAGFIDRDGSYIILTPDGNFKSFQVEIDGLAQEGEYKFTRLWNSEARFVVAGANEFSMLQQTDIFHYLSKFRIYNCIILSREHYIIDQEHSRPINVNDVGTGMNLGVYTWFPYQSSDRCTEVNDITLLDSWVISAQGHFIKNIDLFPVKIRNSFNGCPMKAVVRDGHDSMGTYYTNNMVYNGSHIKGMEMDLLRIILQQMNMTFVHVLTPEGFEIEIGSVNNLVTAMIAKEAYIALGSAIRNFLFYTFFDLTNTYFTTRYRWNVPCSVKYPRWSSIFRILTVELWIVLIISIVIAAILTTLVGRYSCPSEWQRYKTLTSSLINIWAVILGVSVSTMPRTPSLRSLFLAWVCFSVAFNTVFQAFLTTFIIDSGYKTPIQNMDELFASDIKLTYVPDYSFVLEIGDETEVFKVHRNLANCSSYFVCLDWAMYQKNVSILLPDTEIDFLYAIGYLIGENSKPLLCRLEDGVVFPYSLTMMMFPGDPLLRRVNEIIDHVFEAGLYNQWISMKRNWDKLSGRKIINVKLQYGYYSFNVKHLQTAFYLLMIGWFLSFLCFMVEVLYNRVLSKVM